MTTKLQLTCTLSEAQYVLSQAAQGVTFINPNAVRQARDVVTYWTNLRAKQAAVKARRAARTA